MEGNNYKQSDRRSTASSASAAESPTENPDLEISAGDAPPLLPEGMYEAVGGTAHLFRVFGGIKIAVDWIILVPTLEAEAGIERVTLRRYYGARPAPGGRFRVGSHSDFRREWVLIAGRRPSRRDRLSPRIFRGVMCEVEVRTVKVDSRQRILPMEARYSVIRHVVRVIAGGGR